jgi:hypothetical protein
MSSLIKKQKVPIPSSKEVTAMKINYSVGWEILHFGEWADTVIFS